MKRALTIVLCLFMLMAIPALGESDVIPSNDAPYDVPDPIGAPSVEELTEGYFKVLAGLETEAAGASLKTAVVASEVCAFAAEHWLYDPDVDQLRANMLTAFEAMSPEEQEAANKGFDAVLPLLDDCLEDWEGNRALFEDAGVADAMDEIMYDPLNRLAWRNLRDHTLTLGNDPGDDASEEDPLTAKAEDSLHASIQRVVDSPAWVQALPAAQDENVTQLFIVAGYGMDKSSASVSMHQRDENGAWKRILSTPGLVGRNGLCLDEDHAEGCGQTPIGTYHFTDAFGIAADPGCSMAYTQVDEDIYWSGDENQRYNEMVLLSEYPDLDMENSEHIIDYEYEYQYCLNISFNEDGTPGRGSAIFLHCLGTAKPYTGGCVAIPENIMEQVMQNVREDCVVVIDTMENMNVSF